ncbi:intermembrane transport protein PqiB [Marinobacterium arenosum]|uniref:intermembrane transport protein PqiB n=1 Tax=Marinobacterium arenosum TaxID=2862496 RepID=UPI001C967644|nr:intermembrane transport protein PqiB [Marinobacterium arenosum]MBY4675316.1 intermembrane transport protein PqiB [Marinobacterium arenosum]
MTTPDAEIRPTRSLSVIWIIPLVAALIGVWMVYQNWANQGPMITLHFESAEGIEAGKTQIRTLNVVVGRVETLELAENDRGVIVKARMAPNARRLLRGGSQFWVVRPRIGSGGISGLGTLVSGAYIEMRPGSGKEDRRRFTGLETPPITPPDAPGIRLKLVSDSAKSLNIGDSVTYRGYEVGRIETLEFDAEARQLNYELFIRAPFDRLVSQGSRFWNTSGVSISASAEGIKLAADSLNTLLAGGIAFEVPEGWPRGEPASDGDQFRLYPNQAAALEGSYSHYIEYLLQFDQSIRGLKPGAPVEFRGIRVGTVSGVAEALLPSNVTGLQAKIPVLIRIEPGRMGLFDTEQSDQYVASWIERGLRASLKSGNLLTGALYVDLDLYPDSEPASIEVHQGYAVIPTISGGLQRLESKVFALLEKLEKLPLEPVLNQADASLAEARRALQQLNQTLQGVDTLLQSQPTRQLPAELSATLQQIRQSARSLSPDSPLYDELGGAARELRATLNKLQPVLDTLNDRPSALIFDRAPQQDPMPGGES